jgi:arylformamidase
MDYENLSDDERHALNVEYLPRLTVTNADEFIAKSGTRSAAARARLNGLIDIAYGDSDGQTLDIYPAEKPGSPVHVFIHGGYWRAMDKNLYSEMAAPFLAAGAAMVQPNYDLCPAVTIPDIVDQVRRSITWVHANIAEHNGNPDRIHISGHSAGGHLTGMMMATDWNAMFGLPQDLIKGATPLSGVFDIEPHRHTDLQPDIRLSAEDAAACSPQNLDLHYSGPVICAVGGGESGSFKRQSSDFTAKCQTHGLACDYVETGNDNHFEITGRLADGNDDLTRAMLAQMGL